MSNDEQNASNKAAGAGDKQDSYLNNTGHKAGSGTEGQINAAEDSAAADEDEDTKDSGSASEDGDTDNDHNNDHNGDDNGDDNDDDIIHVAQTPTSTALLTQLEHNRIESESRGLGAGHTGSAIFYMQRLTALALIPLTVWFVVDVVTMTTGPRAQVAAWLSGPIHAVLVALFIIIGLRHAVIGIRIILEDYVREEPWHRTCLFTTQAIALLAGAASIAALIHLALIHLAL